MGILPGVVGTLQATEVVKLVLGIGESLMGTLLSFNALASSFNRYRIRKNPHCPVCGSEPSITELIDYEDFCGQGLQQSSPDPDGLAPLEFVQQWAEGKRPSLVDVREPYEWEIANLADYGAELHPLDELEERASAWERDRDIVVHCKSGGRSAEARKRLAEMGFRRVRNLKGGILAWKSQVDDSLPTY